MLCYVADDIRRALLDQAVFRCQELRAAELTWEEIARQFDGEDPRDPELRERAKEVSARLNALLQRLSARRPLPEPTPQQLDERNQRLERAFGYFNLRVTWQ